MKKLYLDFVSLSCNNSYITYVILTGIIESERECTDTRSGGRDGVIKEERVSEKDRGKTKVEQRIWV